MAIIGVVSGKGGVGKTTLVSSLAYALNELDKKVLIVDCNVSTPHLSYYLGVSDYKYTINDIFQGKIDPISAISYCDGVRYIPASLKMEDLVNVDPMLFYSQVSKLSKIYKFDFIFLDSAPGMGREALSVLQSSEEVIFVTTPFVPMINDILRVKRVLKEFKQIRAAKLVLNMVTGGKHEIASNYISKLTSLPLLGEIPYDSSVIYSLVNKSPVIRYQPNSLASLSIRKIAHQLVGKDYKAPKMSKINILRKIFSMFPNTAAPESYEQFKKEVLVKH